MPLRLMLAIWSVIAGVSLVAAPAAMAHDGGGGEARVTGSCGRSASSELRLKDEGGSIRVEFVVRSRARGRWRVVLIHERRVAWRGGVRSDGSGFRVRRSVRDLAGPDEIRMRAYGPGGATCSGSATLVGA